MLIKKGAEASLYLEEWHGRKAILKTRHPKKHRIGELDRQIQVQRTKHEPQIIHRAREAGVMTPCVFMVDLAESTIVMEYIEGKQIKTELDHLSHKDVRSICRRIGRLVGKLHANGIVHGDLTTSNMILTVRGEIALIDFGLSEQTRELESQGTDLHLMKRALMSIHYQHSEECFNAIVQGYEEIIGHEVTKEILGKINEIQKRGRYVSGR